MSRAILHIDGDAFFASCEQSRDPKLRNKPVITGKERGIATSLSYEAKERGVRRGMPLQEIKRLCPEAIFLPSDYETYSLLSKRFFSIVRRYTPAVEEYSIDECFAELTGLRRSHHMPYSHIARTLKHELDTKLGFTFSIGLAPTKVLAKIGSKWKKPSGLTVIPPREIASFLSQLDVEDVWGIGTQTGAFLRAYGINSAQAFARTSDTWIRKNLAKPHCEIHTELNGESILLLETHPKEHYASIQKTKTFTPPSSDSNVVFSQLAKNIENACMKARRYRLEAPVFALSLKTQNFRYSGAEIRLSKASSLPHHIIRAAREPFEKIFQPQTLYRATGITLLKLKKNTETQLDLFGESVHTERSRELFEAVDHLREKYGKHTIYLGPSHVAQATYKKVRDHNTKEMRKADLLPGETKRRRLDIPMFLGKVL